MKKNQIKTQKFNKTQRIIAIFISLLMIVLILLGIRFIRYIILEIEVADVENYTNSTVVDMLTIRNETIIYAPSAGIFTSSLDNGERIHAGGTIGYMNAEGSSTNFSRPVNSSNTGIVFYDLDGWEEILKISDIDNIDIDKVIDIYENNSIEDHMDGTIHNITQNEKRPVAKIVDNLVSSYISSTNQITLKYTDNEDKFIANVHNYGRLNSGNYYIIAWCECSENTIINHRHLQAYLMGESFHGVAIPSTAIFENGSKKIVYRANSNKLEAASVNIIFQNDELAFVEGVNEGDRIVSNPNLAREGQWVKSNK